MYMENEVVEKDIVTGIKWIKQAAENGHSEAQFQLGLCYEEGIGVHRNVNDAIFWYRKASLQGHEEATERVDMLDD